MAELGEYRQGVEELIEGTRDAITRSVADQEALLQRVQGITEIRERADTLKAALTDASRAAMEIVEMILAEGNAANELVSSTAGHAKDAEELLAFGQETVGESHNAHAAAAITNLGSADDEATQTASLTSYAHAKIGGIATAMDGVEQIISTAVGEMATFEDGSYELLNMFQGAAGGAERTAESGAGALTELEEYKGEIFE